MHYKGTGVDIKNVAMFSRKNVGSMQESRTSKLAMDAGMTDSCIPF